MLENKSQLLVFHLFIFALFYALPITGASGYEGNHIKVGIDEKLGQTVPMNLVFRDESGKPISLAEVSGGKPLILDLAYFTCPGICDQVLVGLSDVIDRVDAKPGRDFKVATISFDPADTPQKAMDKKEQYWGMLHRPFPANDWKFLTSDSVTIRQLTDAVGFYYMRDRYLKFTHPTALFVLSKDGKICRYIYGTSFLPEDLKMALLDAQGNRADMIVSRVLQMCFSHDPGGNKLVFNIMSIVGLGTMIFIAGFIVFLISTKKFVKPNR
ncbi:MAG: SCO family protein, partial [Candidatus Kryptoniota bacterium]